MTKPGFLRIKGGTRLILGRDPHGITQRAESPKGNMNPELEKAAREFWLDWIQRTDDWDKFELAELETSLPARFAAAFAEDQLREAEQRLAKEIEDHHETITHVEVCMAKRKELEQRQREIYEECAQIAEQNSYISGKYIAAAIRERAQRE